MSYRITRAIASAHHVTGARRAVLYALNTFADRNGTNAFPAQSTLAAAAGVCDRTVRRALAWLEAAGIIRRTGGRRSPRGRAVIVWRIVCEALAKPDMGAGRPAKHLQKKEAFRGKKVSEADAWAILAHQYGWDTLQKWSDQAISSAIERISGRYRPQGT